MNKYRELSKEEYNKQEWTIHPLSILTAYGNGLGGGDYDGNNMDYVGAWAYEEISFEDEIPEGYSELEVCFKE